MCKIVRLVELQVKYLKHDSERSGWITSGNRKIDSREKKRFFINGKKLTSRSSSLDRLSWWWLLRWLIERSQVRIPPIDLKKNLCHTGSKYVSRSNSLSVVGVLQLKMLPEHLLHKAKQVWTSTVVNTYVSSVRCFSNLLEMVIRH